MIRQVLGDCRLLSIYLLIKVIIQIMPKEYCSLKEGELDLLSGGAPCQAFSYAGKRLGFLNIDTVELVRHYWNMHMKQQEIKDASA